MTTLFDSTSCPRLTPLMLVLLMQSVWMYWSSPCIKRMTGRVNIAIGHLSGPSYECIIDVPTQLPNNRSSILSLFNNFVSIVVLLGQH